MTQFEFPAISNSLIEELAASLQCGQSVIVLGGRNVGKRYIVRRVYRHLLAAGRDVRVASLLGAAEQDTTAQEKGDHFLSGIPDLMTSAAEILAWWRSRQSAPAAANLLISNLDGLPAQDCLELVRELRALGWCSLLVTGEAQSAQHCTGTEAPLRSDRMLVVSGFARGEFAIFARRYLRILRLAAADEERCIDDLYQRTGGNAYLLRVLLWVAFEGWAAEEGDEAETLTLDHVPDTAIAEQVPWNHYLRYVTRLIASAPCPPGARPALWDRLERLLRDGVVPADANGPDLLELTGIPVRKDGQLHLGKQVVGQFLKRHYSEQKLADLHVGRDDWKGAFERLAALPPDKRAPRPMNLDDVADASFLVKRLAASLYGEAAVGVEAVRARFRQGCQLLLGFSEVSFWTHGPRQAEQWYDTEAPQITAPSWIAQVLSADPLPGAPSLYGVPASEERRALVAVIPSTHPACRAAVEVRDSAGIRPLSQARMNLLLELVGEFVVAYGHARDVEKFKRQAGNRHALADVLTDILSELGLQVLTIGKAVERATTALWEKFQYRRVLVSLLDARRERIEGYFEASDDPDQKARKATNYALEPPDTSIHVAAIRSGTSQLVPDFPGDARAFQPSVEESHSLAGAVVLLDTGRRSADGKAVVLGTLMIERRDDLPPDPEEFADLVQFARKLAGIIEQGERIQLLQATLDKQREPLAIFDAGWRLRYANTLAAEELGPPFTPGWKHPEAAPHLDWGTRPNADSLANQVLGAVHDAFKFDNRVVNLAEASSFQKKGPQSWAVLADVIHDPGTGRTLGAFMESQSLSFLQQLFAGLVRMLDPDVLWPQSPGTGEGLPLNPTERLIDEFGLLFTAGPAPTSIYFDALEGEGRHLVRRRWYNRSRGANDAVPYSYPAEGQTVACFEKSSPTAFYFDQWQEFPDGQQIISKIGLVVTSVRHAVGYPATFHGPFIWIDFPVFTRQRRLGKFVFACRQDFRPEEFVLLERFLAPLCGIVGAILELASRYERASEEQARQREEAAREAVETFIHHLKRPLKSAPILVDRLQQFATADERLRTILDRFEDMVRRFTHYARLASETTSMSEVLPHPRDLFVLLKGTLDAAAPRGRYVLSPPCPEGDSTAHVDEPHLALALSELIENSRKYCPEDTLQISLAWQFAVEEGRTWVVLLYQDNGPGFQEGERASLFRHGAAFLRGDHKLGTGRGLHYVASVVQKHGNGRIELLSRGAEGSLGSGACFRIRFPRHSENSGGV